MLLDRAAIVVMVEDFWRSFIPVAFAGDERTATLIVERFQKQIADMAGLMPEDVLVQFGEKPINNLYYFTDALRRSKVGDVVEVKVMRDGKPVAAQVKLEQRR